jgi:hypothetical protein
MYCGNEFSFDSLFSTFCLGNKRWSQKFKANPTLRWICQGQRTTGILHWLPIFFCVMSLSSTSIITKGSKWQTLLDSLSSKLLQALYCAALSLQLKDALAHAQ